ncbi:hypothetical protein BDV33DRAFT_201890 [Aspergillus novoparasiticus]|uniref:Uncharacterized protein n=1 Tax=Aspergillus novoparasiticus TaxID=986946 RepID=A0A5N6EWC1_9EURO|nr:hypothetical protein BDV33DRAFT_201890 [Aspergillus novoparasiticus]
MARSGFKTLRHNSSVTGGQQQVQDRTGVPRQTLALLNLGVSVEDEPAPADPNVIITDLLREWDYGGYEGLTASAAREIRQLKGLDQMRWWNIRKDGCEGSPLEVRPD